MLMNHTLDTLRTLKLTGMADAFTEQREQSSTHELSFDERFSLLVEREATYRENRRLTRLLQLARLKQNACIEDIDCNPSAKWRDVSDWSSLGLLPKYRFRFGGDLTWIRHRPLTCPT